MKKHHRLPRVVTLVLLLLAGGLAASASALAAQEGPDAGAAEETRTIRIKILGMSCPFCAYGAEQKLKKLDGVRELDVKLKTGLATLTLHEGGDVSNEVLKKTVDDAGFEAAAIVRNFDSEHPDWNPDEIPSGSESGLEGSGL